MPSVQYKKQQVLNTIISSKNGNYEIISSSIHERIKACPSNKTMKKQPIQVSVRWIQLCPAKGQAKAYYFKLGNQPTADVPVMNMSDEFHTYSVIWTPEKITGLVDDKAYFEYSDTSTDLAWPFSRPQNLILNLAMGGGWGGAQGMDESMTQQDLIIDYVRVYELE